MAISPRSHEEENAPVMVLPAQTSLPTEHRQETHTHTRTDVYEGETNGNCQEQQTKTWVDVAAAGENTRRNRGLIQFGIPPCPYFLRSTDRHKIASDCLFVSFGDFLSPVIRLPPPPPTRPTFLPPDQR